MTDLDSGSFTSGAHWKGFLEYHFEWCPKKRYKVLRQERFKNVLLESLRTTAQRIKLELVEVGIQDNHVHVVADLRSWHSPAWVMERLKCESAARLFSYEPKFRLRYPKGHFWAPGKFYRTVSNVTSDVVRAYVRAQDHRQKLLTDFGEAA
jgi:putative transposase